MKTWAMAAVAASCLTGCFADRSEDPAARARLAEEVALGAQLEQAADHLEGRMLETQSNVHLWQEMAWRHQRVSAIAVVNSDQHFQAMVKMFDAQQEKARKLKRPRTLADASITNASDRVGNATVLSRAVASRHGRRGAQ